MIELLPDLLRSLITNAGLAVLLFSLGKPRKSLRLRVIVVVLIVLVDMAANLYFYLRGDYSDLAKFDILFFILVGLASKPLFEDKATQWLFNCLTVMNVYSIVVAISYYLCGLFPHPDYAITVIRLVMLAGTVYIFRVRLRPLYRQVAELWDVYSLVSVGTFMNFAWYFISSDDIEQTLQASIVPILLLCMLTLLVYITIILSLRNIQHEYELREENQRMQANQEYLTLSAKAMADRIALMNKTVQQSRIAAHDRRHLTNALLGMLEAGHAEDAASLLRMESYKPASGVRSYCSNPAVDAAVGWYARLAEDAGIKCEISIDLGTDLEVDALELSMVMANLMENAIHGCSKVALASERYIRLNCCNAGRLLVEIENPCDAGVKLDENGQPRASEKSHGTGSRSIAAFAAKYDGELLYQVSNGVFRVRLLV
ncbi:MAG: GHKL domain-containing protein [Sphaerochaetaceae bacterium]